MPIVVDQAVPSELQSTVGSEWKESPLASGRMRLAPGHAAVGGVVLPCVPEPPMLFEAAMILVGFQ